SSDLGRFHPRQRRLDGARRQLQIARHLVAKKKRNLAQQAAETCGRGFLVAHDRQLVLDKWMIDDGYALHYPAPRYFCSTGTITAKHAPEHRARAAGQQFLLPQAGCSCASRRDNSLPRVSSSTKAASRAVRVTDRSAVSLSPKCSAATAYSRARFVWKCGGSSELSVMRQPAATSCGSGWCA